MRLRSHSRQRARLRRLALLTAGILVFLWLLLPYESTVRLALRWNLKRLQRALPGSRPNESWAYSQPQFPFDMAEDTVVVVKTGYGTRERAAAWFKALGARSEFRDFLVTADFASHPEEYIGYRGKELPIYDMVNRTLSEPVLASREMHPRFTKYQRLAEAIEGDDEELALHLARTSGWELDALKVIALDFWFFSQIY